MSARERYANGSLLVGCHAIIPGIGAAYGYVPSLPWGIVYCILFFLSFALHLIRGIQYRRWTSYCLSIGAVVELIGWGGRTFSSKCPYNKTAFLTQISTLVIAPTFIAAAIYLVLARLILRRGAKYSLLGPKAYLWTFCTCDLMSLLIQASGGGIASSAANKNTDTRPGTRIIVSGILFQLISMTVFSACLAVFLWRSRKVVVPSGEKKVVYALILSLVCVYIRSAYRTIELFQGWQGYLITTEKYFVALDAAMMVIAVLVFNIWDPAVLLEDGVKNEDARMEGTSSEEGDARAGIVETREKKSFFRR